MSARPLERVRPLGAESSTPVTAYEGTVLIRAAEMLPDSLPAMRGVSVAARSTQREGRSDCGEAGENREAPNASEENPAPDKSAKIKTLGATAIKGANRS